MDDDAYKESLHDWLALRPPPDVRLRLIAICDNCDREVAKPPCVCGCYTTHPEATDG